MEPIYAELQTNSKLFTLPSSTASSLSSGHSEDEVESHLSFKIQKLFRMLAYLHEFYPTFTSSLRYFLSELEKVQIIVSSLLKPLHFSRNTRLNLKLNKKFQISKFTFTEIR